MDNITQLISKIGIVPVIALDKAEDAAPLAEALCKGGLPCAEVTFRTAAAEESIRIMTEKFPQMLVGAGTVLTTEQADRAIAAGAKFIVSPGLNPTVVKHCIQRSVPIVPGCANPSDIEAAIELGLDVVKFFPAEAAGGIKMIKAMSAPYGNIRFMPTGGINADNINDYLSFSKIIACGGSWMVSKDMITAGEFDKITELTKGAVQKMLGFSLAHIGINTDNEAQALSVAALFESMFGFNSVNGNSSVFAGKGIEVMKSQFKGKNGHIAIGTNSVERAVYHLEARGVSFDKSTEKRDASGRLKTVYLSGDFGGFAVHLVEK